MYDCIMDVDWTSQPVTDAQTGIFRSDRVVRSPIASGRRGIPERARQGAVNLVDVVMALAGGGRRGARKGRAGRPEHSLFARTRSRHARRLIPGARNSGYEHTRALETAAGPAKLKVGWLSLATRVPPSRRDHPQAARRGGCSDRPRGDRRSDRQRLAWRPKPRS